MQRFDSLRDKTLIMNLLNRMVILVIRMSGKGDEEKQNQTERRKEWGRACLGRAKNTGV